MRILKDIETAMDTHIVILHVRNARLVFINQFNFVTYIKRYYTNTWTVMST
jgi:hypothetical protein